MTIDDTEKKNSFNPEEPRRKKDAAQNDAPLVESNVTVVCCLVCGSPAAEFKSWMKGTTANLTCKECGAKISLKNGVVGSVMANKSDRDRLKEDAISIAANIYKTTAEQRDNAAKNRPLAAKGLFTLSTRFTEGMLRNIRAAMQKWKKETGYKGTKEDKAWMGIALDAICADFLAGFDHKPLNVDKDTFTTAGLAKISGKALINTAAFIFIRGIRRMFSSDDDIRQWILKNYMPEFFDATPDDEEPCADDMDGEADAKPQT